ncbi:MAG: hypothetical protein U0X20_29930 [Caldilineaceae bacterium]
MPNKLFTRSLLLVLSLSCSLVLSQVLSPPPVLAQQESGTQPPSVSSADNTAYAIAYVGPSRDSRQIRLVDPDGSNDRLLWAAPPDTQRQDGIGELSWRSDAGELAFDSGHDWHRSLYVRDIYALTPSGGGFRRLTRPPAAGGTNAYPTGTVSFWVQPNTVGDVELYVEGMDHAVSIAARSNLAYSMTLTVADLGPNVRQYIRLYDPTGAMGVRCDYNQAGWVDVVAGQVTDIGTIWFGFGTEYTCPSALRPAWLLNRNELLYLAAEADGSGLQDDSNVWRIAGDAPPASPGERILDYSQYVADGRLTLAVPGRTAATANQFLAVVDQTPWSPSIFRAPVDDPGQREFINWGRCRITCDITGLAWLPDGSGFLFSLTGSDYGAGGKIEQVGAIYHYTFADETLTELYRISKEAIGRLDLSPDGAQIVFERSNGLDATTQNHWLRPTLLCPCQLWLINSDGTNAHLFVQDGRAPVWSPAPLTDTAPPPQGEFEAAVFLPLVKP